jgi:hypothetical protein
MITRWQCDGVEPSAALLYRSNRLPTERNRVRRALFVLLAAANFVRCRVLLDFCILLIRPGCARQRSGASLFIWRTVRNLARTFCPRGAQLIDAFGHCSRPVRADRGRSVLARVQRLR